MIINFNQKPAEGLLKAYMIYRTLVDNCPHQNLPPWLVLHYFYVGLNDTSRTEIDFPAGDLLWSVM